MERAAIFDLDGTLIDTLETLAFFVNAETERYGIQAIPAEAFKVFAGNGARVLVERALRYAGNTDEHLVDVILPAFIAAYNADFLHLTRVYAGVSDLLYELHHRGVRLAVLSNKQHETTQKIVGHFFPDLFSIVLGQREGVPIKPDPSAVHEILRHVRVPSEQTVYVGDTGTDMKTGRAAGLYSAGVLWGFRDKEELVHAGASTVISQPQELLDIVMGRM